MGQLFQERSDRGCRGHFSGNRLSGFPVRAVGEHRLDGPADARRVFPADRAPAFLGVLADGDLYARAGLGHFGGVGELVGEHRDHDEGHAGGQGAVGRARPAVADHQRGLAQDIGLFDPCFHVHVSGNVAQPGCLEAVAGGHQNPRVEPGDGVDHGAVDLPGD
jgi:hypothetical protein